MTQRFTELRLIGSHICAAGLAAVVAWNFGYYAGFEGCRKIHNLPVSPVRNFSIGPNHPDVEIDASGYCWIHGDKEQFDACVKCHTGRWTKLGEYNHNPARLEYWTESDTRSPLGPFPERPNLHDLLNK